MISTRRFLVLTAVTTLLAGCGGDRSRGDEECGEAGALLLPLGAGTGY